MIKQNSTKATSKQTKKATVQQRNKKKTTVQQINKIVKGQQHIK